MKKLFEIDLNEDYKSSLVSQYILMFLTLSLSVMTRGHERTFIEFNFILEFFLLAALFNFYFKAQKQRNYSFWGISLLLGLYLLKIILKYTFIDYQMFLLYPALLAGLFLFINCYIMSSPLFYPRVQWWEYDFRYRGDLKSFIKLGETVIESRVTDLRRDAACVESFERLDLDTTIDLEVEHDNNVYLASATIKTSKEYVKGRPIRYGIVFDLENEKVKNEFNKLKKVWNKNKKVKIRKKFSELKEGHEVSRNP